MMNDKNIRIVSIFEDIVYRLSKLHRRSLLKFEFVNCLAMVNSNLDPISMIN